MKKNLLLLFALGCLCVTSAFAFSSIDNKQQVYLRNKHDITDASRPHRAPSRNQCPLTLFYCDDLGELEFACSKDVTEIIVNIYDNENQIVITEVIGVFSSDSTSISISSLPEGNYVIELIIEESHYMGEFTVL